ncbi:hypothetical protein TRIP_B110073 [uncultured Desulfatiglans sp.]|nr:hypothetical protein TRIP_B110073 [uncultured Desulfatiglans sp.]
MLSRTGCAAGAQKDLTGSPSLDYPRESFLEAAWARLLIYGHSAM